MWSEEERGRPKLAFARAAAAIVCLYLGCVMLFIPGFMGGSPKVDEVSMRVTVMKDGDKKQEDGALPPDARLPFAARELFLRETKALSGRLDAPVYDTRDQRWRPTSYSEGGHKPVDADLRRFRAEAAELLGLSEKND